MAAVALATLVAAPAAAAALVLLHLVARARRIAARAGNGRAARDGAARNIAGRVTAVALVAATGGGQSDHHNGAKHGRNTLGDVVELTPRTHRETKAIESIACRQTSFLPRGRSGAISGEARFSSLAGSRETIRRNRPSPDPRDTPPGRSGVIENPYQGNLLSSPTYASSQANTREFMAHFWDRQSETGKFGQNAGEASRP